MQRPRQRGNGRNTEAFSFIDVIEPEEREGENKQRDRGGGMEQDIGQMIRRGTKGERPILQRVGQPLNRAIKIRRSRINKQKMLKAFWNQSPAADERIAQDQRGIIPNEGRSQRWSVRGENQDYEHAADDHSLFH